MAAALCALCIKDKNWQYLPPANEVWDKVIFSEACVKNSVHRGGAWSPGGVPGPGGWGVPGPGGWGVPGPGGGVCADPPRWLLLRAVRILLECILVEKKFHVTRNSAFFSTQ